jgi:hypothetical protein
LKLRRVIAVDRSAYLADILAELFKEWRVQERCELLRWSWAVQNHITA